RHVLHAAARDRGVEHGQLVPAQLQHRHLGHGAAQDLEQARIDGHAGTSVARRDALRYRLSGEPSMNSEAQSAPRVGVVMGSRSDWETLKHAAETLERLGIAHEVRVVSAHRTPELLFEYAGRAA